MNKKKLFNFLIFIPFAIAVGSFVLYFKYLFTIKSAGASKVSEMLTVSLVRYRNIGVFCLALGVFLLFIKTLFDYFRIDDDLNVRNERVLDKISNRIETEDTKYTFNENNIISDLLGGKVLKAVFHNSDIQNRLISFKGYNSNNNTIEFVDLSKTNKKTVKKEETKVISSPVINEYVVSKKEPKFDGRYFKRCYKCDNVIAKDAVMCVHCGTMLKETKEEKKRTIFNPIIFVLNLIVILLCIILVLLCLSRITGQSRINRNNLNINTIQINK